MNPHCRAASLVLAILFAVFSFPVQSQQNGVAHRVEALESLVAGLVTANGTLQGQVTALQAASAALQGQVSGLQAALNSEIAARQAGDQTLQNAINAEASVRLTADGTLQGNLDQEIAVRGAADTDLQAQIAAIDTGAGAIPGLADYLTVDTATHTVLFKGANVQIVNGMGSTATLNGRGNLIVGYNAPRAIGRPVCSDGQHPDQAACAAAGQLWADNHKSGSHNIVGGDRNSYSSYGGLLLGHLNVINREYANVSGLLNIASGPTSSVSGGFRNTASGSSSSVSGGFSNTASGSSSSVSGGFSNTASGEASSVSGGANNTASGVSSSVSGGAGNIASGQDSSVSGGARNTASGQLSSVSGGVDCDEARLYGWSVGFSGATPPPGTRTPDPGCNLVNFP